MLLLSMLQGCKMYTSLLSFCNVKGRSYEMPYSMLVSFIHK